VFEMFPIKIPSSELLVNYLDRHIIDELLEVWYRSKEEHIVAGEKFI
jgi:hypothetical protein